MIVSDKEAVARLTNPINLINSIALRKKNISSSHSKAMSLFGLSSTSQVKPAIQEKLISPAKDDFKPFNPFENIKSVVTPILVNESVNEINLELSANLPTQPTVDSILDNSDQHIKLSLAHDSALEVLNTSVAMLALKLDEVKADKLPSVITAASKVVESIRRERIELNKNGKNREVHYHFYTPEQRKISDYEVIEVSR